MKEETRDLVIVGGGLGGLSAANAAVNKGCKALVIEKLPFLGGAGIMPEGSLGINTKYQKAHGIKTTAQQVLDAALQFHHFRADPAVLRVLIEESTRTIDEIIDHGRRTSRHPHDVSEGRVADVLAPIQGRHG